MACVIEQVARATVVEASTTVAGHEFRATNCSATLFAAPRLRAIPEAIGLTAARANTLQSQRPSPLGETSSRKRSSGATRQTH